MTRLAVALPVLAALAGALAPAALAHARPIASVPADGAVLSRAPRDVRVAFDDAVQVLGGIRAIRNGGGSVLRGRPFVAKGGRELVIPLRRNLPNGDYTVRWRARSDDGHTLSGVLAFGVGAGRPPPTPALSAGSGNPGAADLLSRWLVFAGIALAFGGVVFDLAVWRRAVREAGVGAPESSAASAVVVAGFVFALVGIGQLHGGVETRFDRANAAGAVAAIVGAAIAAIGWIDRRARPLALLPALALVVVPPLRGHALDPGHSRVFAFSADLIHVVAAALWIGGLAQLVLVVPRAPAEVRRLATERFSRIAFGAVLVVAVTGSWRALGELRSIEQLWSTGYGRTLVVKTALLAVLVGLGWLNRERLLPRLGTRRGLGRFRRSVAAELLVLGGVLVAVAVLTSLKPGRLMERPPAAVRQVGRQPILPPSRPGTVVLAQQQGDLAVALAAVPAGRSMRLTATVLGQDGRGVDGAAVSFELARRTLSARDCGSGCYAVTVDGTRPRIVRLLIGERSSTFAFPSRWPGRPAARLMTRVERAYRSLRTVVLHERLASSPRHAISTTFQYVAPDRMTYRIEGGPEAVSIGRRRWDRAAPGARWVRSDQSPSRVPKPFWSSVSDASVLGTGRIGDRGTWRISFLDRRPPAWFEVEVDRETLRPLRLKMTAAAHFMRHRYGSFNRPLTILPPAG